MFSKEWLRDVAERVVGTVAAVVLAVVAMDGVTVLTVDWKNTAALAATAGLVTVLKAVAARKVGDPESAALLR